jgi:hypothetical protein
VCQFGRFAFQHITENHESDGDKATAEALKSLVEKLGSLMSGMANLGQKMGGMMGGLAAGGLGAIKQQVASMGADVSSLE